MGLVVSTLRQGEIATILVDSPPVNALGFAVRDGIASALAALERDEAVEVVILRCAGRTFFAGADITEFGKPMREPDLRRVIEHIEAFPKPIIAAIHGTALGGGLEIALGCHYRIAVASAQFGLPEVKLGILPGAGGTQRLPRLMGLKPALEVMVSGDFFGADRALATGVIDRIVPELDDAPLAFARSIAAVRPLPIVSRYDEKLREAKAVPSLFDDFAASVARKTRGFPAPARIIDCVKAAVTLDFAGGMKREREGLIELMASPESIAQRYFFFAEREAAKIPDIAADTPVQKITRAAVIGAGTMGGGIAMNCANAGIPVTLIETTQDALDRGLQIIRGNYEATARRGGLTAEEVETRVGLITGSLKLEDIASADIVTEAVFEEMGIKKELFAKLDAFARPDAILASNTSTLDVNEIASATAKPERVLGMHYFSPANVMKLVEVVRGGKTSKSAVASAFAISRRLKKVPVQTGVCYGFVGNRMLHRRTHESEMLLLEGAAPAEIDKAIFDFGFPMGPCAMGDLAGLDVGYRIRRGLGVVEKNIADRLVEAGRMGQKTNAGYYHYEPGSRAPLPDPAVDALIDEVARERGINRRHIPGDEILERLLYPMINEGARILEEGIALRASDVDVVWVYGYGWPVYRGGPMYWADSIGLQKIRDRLAALYDETGREHWKPAALIEQLAAEGGRFAGWKPG
ncbi:MAG: 3-hydroxyacyl-CoA dehydrogenase NAD-binding domain-containing protein [Aliidongia sp.]